MLTIIDIEYKYFKDQQALLIKTIYNLGFPKVSIEQARWIYTYLIIEKHTIRPENYHILDNGKEGLYYIFEPFFGYDDNLQDVEGFTNCLYYIDEAAGDVLIGYIQKNYNDPKTLLKLKDRFFEVCQLWLDRNEAKIMSIFAELYA